MRKPKLNTKFWEEKSPEKAKELLETISNATVWTTSIGIAGHILDMPKVGLTMLITLWAMNITIMLTKMKHDREKSKKEEK